MRCAEGFPMAGRRRAVLTLAALLLVPAIGVAADDAATRPDFSGSWRLDARRSESLDSDDRQAAESPQRDGDDRRPGTGPPRRFDADARRAAGAERVAAFATLDIGRGEGDAWIVRDGRGVERTLVPDGHERRVVEPDGRETWLRCEWRDGDRLFVRRVEAAVPALEESFELADDGQSLLVHWTLVGEQGRGKERLRTYVRAAAGAEPGAAASAPPPRGGEKPKEPRRLSI